ncbi:MAG: hypothetical protein IPH52_25830 [Leptospiraceae bacterium]|nr:hypothetical protein [Leptospiraceae bacterium]
MPFTSYLAWYFSKPIVEREKSHANIDINDCDSIGNYYENGEHYIRRDLFNDDGVIDYNKMLESYKGRNTVCNPLNLEPESKKSN